MPNNRGLLDNMEFEERLLQMGDNQLELLKFVARQQFSMSKLAALHDNDIKKLQSRSKKELGATSGISGFIGVAVASVIDYFLRRQ